MIISITYYCILILRFMRVFNPILRIDNESPMYIKQADPIFSPAGTNILLRVFFSIKNLIWPPDLLNKGKIDFLLQI